MKHSIKYSVRIKAFFKGLGPGLVTGASDDDPSGIATYSQAGAAYGLSTLWTALITLPLMAAIQEMCAHWISYKARTDRNIEKKLSQAGFIPDVIIQLPGYLAEFRGRYCSDGRRWEFIISINRSYLF